MSQAKLRELGFENVCLYCGRKNHSTQDCRARGLFCKFCKRENHVERVCIKKRIQEQSSVKSVDKENRDSDNESNDSYTIHKIVDIYNEQCNLNHDSRKYIVSVSIDNKQQAFEVDSGAGYTLLPKSQFDRLQLDAEIKPAKIRFRSYTQGVFDPIGVATVTVQYKNVTSREILFIVPDEFSPLLGRTWIRRLRISLEDLDKQMLSPVRSSIISTVHTQVGKDIFSSFPNVFKQVIGKIPNISVSHKLIKDAKPRALRSRQVPIFLKQSTEAELDSFEKQGIISKTPLSEWASPLVVIPKTESSVRICVDYKTTVNPQLEKAHFPLPQINDVLNNLVGSSFFCKLDLFKAYLHIPVDEESAKIQTIITHKGAYTFNRLSMGIKTSPNEFHRIFLQLLQECKGVETFFDDIIVHGKTFLECYENLWKLLKVLDKNDLHVNVPKSSFFRNQLEYCGYIISENKVMKDPAKIEAIVNAPRPENAEGVKRFLGMVTYYSKFLPNMSSKTEPMRQLLKTGKTFFWSAECEAAFIDLKQEIASDRVLTTFNPELPITLTTDASPTGIGAILSHKVGTEDRPIAFASRALTSAEQNYTQLDREAVAIVFALKKFYYYIYGKRFTLVTDSKALSRILNENSKLPAMTSARLLRYAAWLTNFDYIVQHKKSEEIAHVDYLSRAPIKTSMSDIEQEFQEEDILLLNEQIYQISNFNLNYHTLKEETEKDQELSKLKFQLIHGENNDPEISIQNDVLFRGQRIMVPVKLQKAVLNELHHTHLGIVKMKQLARQYVYWRSIDKDIENAVKSCSDCAMTRKSPMKAPTHSWEVPTENFERIHIDYAGPHKGHFFFLLVDAKSRWVEVTMNKNAPTSESTICTLQTLFATHGLPHFLASDNAKIFKSETFTTFCQENGIQQKFTAPGKPSTNGIAERNIQTLKQKLKAMEKSSLPIGRQVQEILMKWRATPLACGKSPAELYLNRRLRIKLDLLKPPKKSPVSQRIPGTRQLCVGDRVQARWYDQNKPTWRFGCITKKFGFLHYEVCLDGNGYTLKRHIDQLRHITTPEPENPEKKHVTFAPQLHLFRENSSSQKKTPDSSTSSRKEVGNEKVKQVTPPVKKPVPNTPELLQNAAPSTSKGSRSRDPTPHEQPQQPSGTSLKEHQIERHSKPNQPRKEPEKIVTTSKPRNTPSVTPTERAAKQPVERKKRIESAPLPASGNQLRSSGRQSQVPKHFSDYVLFLTN